MFRAAIGSAGDSRDVTGDNDKRDILDLLKLSYIVVRTGIGTGQIMVIRRGVARYFFFRSILMKSNFEIVKPCPQTLIPKNPNPNQVPIRSKTKGD